MDQGVRERAEARLRALFESNLIGGVAMMLAAGNNGLHLRQWIEVLGRISEEEWQDGVKRASVVSSCPCPRCNLTDKPDRLPSQGGDA